MHSSKNVRSVEKDSSRLKLLFLALPVVAALAVAPAKGALTLTLSEPGFAPVNGTISGNTATFVGTYGDFTTNVVVGFSNVATPTSIAQLQVQSLDVAKNSTSSAQVLTITLSESSYNFPGVVGDSLSLTSSLGGTLTSSAAGDSVSFKSTATPSVGSPVTTGAQAYVAPSAMPGSSSFQVPSASTLFTQTGSYGLTSQIIASFSAPNETANLSGSTTVSAAPVSVPEPATASGVAIMAAGLLSRRRRIA